MALNNGFGTGVVFTSNMVSQNGISGSVLSFKLKKTADKKEITDAGDNFQYIGFTKRKKVGTLEVLFTGSGSAMTLPNVGDTTTATNPTSADCSGNWGVTDSEGTWKNDAGVIATYEITQWYKGDGSTLP